LFGEVDNHCCLISGKPTLNILNYGALKIGREGLNRVAVLRPKVYEEDRGTMVRRSSGSWGIGWFLRGSNKWLFLRPMVYKVIGLMSGSSLDGLDIAYVHLHERVGSSKQTPRAWDFQLVQTDCYPYSTGWRERLAGAVRLSAREYLLLDAEYGRWLGEQVLRFVAAHGLEYQVQLIASHGHTVFHEPARRMTAQLGDGAAIAAETRINVVSDLRAMDVALGGQGAPIVPVGEEILFPDYDLFLNLGGIANVSVSRREGTAGHAGSAGRVAFDVAPANRVMNELALDVGLPYDNDGLLAGAGGVNEGLLGRLNALSYYGMSYPKSLANEFGLEEVLPLVRGAGLTVEDALRTYVEHLVEQIGRAVAGRGRAAKMLVTGGGAHNGFLIGRLRVRLEELGVEVVVPEAAIIDYKEALVMALIGVLRWREENNVLASVTGASRDSIGGAVWLG
jgi:anhydro-N-acetylmuramic acid kinase